MKHAVILAHPNSRSFSAAVARTCVRALKDAGDEVVLRDLYAMGFDPRLQAREIPGATDWGPEPDVAAERKRLADVDSFIFVYPFWFNAPPAILKGYIERVFGLGFGYDPGMEPRLSGRTLFSISTSGAPEHWVGSTGALRSLMEVFDFHLANVCGLRVVDHLHLGSVLSNLERAAGAVMLERVRTTIRALFSVEVVRVNGDTGRAAGAVRAGTGRRTKLGG